MKWMEYIGWHMLGKRVMKRIVFAAHECGVIDSRGMHLLCGALCYYRERQVDYTIYFMCASTDGVRMTNNSTNK